MEEAGNGAIMVSARISAGEQEIMNEMVNHGFPVIIIADNGFPERYHPELRCPSPLPPKRRLVEKQRIKCSAVRPLQSRKQCSAVRPLQKKKTVFSGSPAEIKILKI